MKFKAINYDNTKFATLLIHPFFSQDTENSFTISHSNEETIINVDGVMTDEFLRFIVGQEFAVPMEATWMKITQEVAEGKIPTEPYDLGDGRKNFDSVYYTSIVDGEYYYVVGRTSVDSTGKPTGNYQGELSNELFFLHVDAFGVDNLYVDTPQGESVGLEI